MMKIKMTRTVAHITTPPFFCVLSACRTDGQRYKLQGSGTDAANKFSLFQETLLGTTYILMHTASSNMNGERKRVRERS
jgi:hypothetical protein